MKILLAEDEDGARRIICRVLESVTCRMVAVSTLEEVRSKIIAEKFGVIILDLGLVDSDRYSTLGAIPWIKKMSGAQIIAISGGVELDLREKAIEGGADAFISKVENGMGASAIIAAVGALILHDEECKYLPPAGGHAATVLETLVGKDEKRD